MELKLSTSQILLTTELASESVNIFEPVLSPKFYRRHPKFRYLSRRKNSMENHHVRMEETTDTDGEGVKDSGVEVTDESHHYQVKFIIKLIAIRKFKQFLVNFTKYNFKNFIYDQILLIGTECCQEHSTKVSPLIKDNLIRIN